MNTMLERGKRQQKKVVKKIVAGVAGAALKHADKKVAQKNGRIEGYWSSNDGEDGLPVPKPFEGRGWRTRDQVLEAMIAVEAVAESTHYKGFSPCRICKCRNGSGEYKYKGWTWPSGLYHYINIHNVRPSTEFEEFIMAEAKRITKKADERRKAEVKTRRLSEASSRRRTTSRKSDPALPFNVVKDRKAWKIARDRVERAANWSEFLSRLHDLLITPRTCVFSATEWDPKSGEPIAGKWVKTSDSKRSQVFHYTRYNELRSDFKLPKCAVVEFRKYLEFFAKGNGPVIYDTMDSPNNYMGRTLVLSREYIQTGGGHNDSPSFASSVRVEVAHASYGLLSGAKMGEA